MPKVSVILTSYNHAKYLKEAIDSVLAQTFQDFELILWDDASQDDSWSIMKGYSDNRRIKAFRNDENRRGIYGVNKAITEVASGEYIAIHHSDDIWEPAKLERQVAFLEKNKTVGAVFTHALVIDEEGELLKDPSNFYSAIFDQPNRPRYEWLNFFFHRGNALCHPSVLIRKECYQHCGFYRFGFAQLADLDMWVRLCMKYEIHVLPEKLVRFRIRKNEANASGDRAEVRIRAPIEFYDLLKNFLQLKTMEEIRSIFPDAQRYDRQDSGFEPRFVLAMIALNDSPFPGAKLFGMELLFDLIFDPKSAKKIRSLYGFDYRDLIAKTSEYDIFSVELVADLRRALAEREEQIARLDQAAADLRGKLDSLNQTLAERDAQNARLSQSLAALNEKINDLKSDLRERKRQITILTGSVADHDGQIAALTGFVAERDKRISDLSHTVADRDKQTAALSNSLADRGKQITALSNTVADRDKQVAVLSNSVADRDGQIALISNRLSQIESSLLWHTASTLWRTIKSITPRSLINLFKQIAQRNWHASHRMEKAYCNEGGKLDPPTSGDRPRLPVKKSWLSHILRLLSAPVRCSLRPGRHLRILKRSTFFDAPYYCEVYRDVLGKGVDPQRHYLEKGWKEHLDPGPFFNTGWYLQQNPDVLAAGINPLLHFIEHGAAEGRAPMPLQSQTDQSLSTTAAKSRSRRRPLEPLAEHSTVYAFTSICLNYLPKARVLAETLKQHNPQVRFCLLVNEPIPDHLLNSFDIFDEVATLEDLNIPNKQAWVFRHSVVELCTA